MQTATLCKTKGANSASSMWIQFDSTRLCSIRLSCSVLQLLWAERLQRTVGSSNSPPHPGHMTSRGVSIMQWNRVYSFQIAWVKVEWSFKLNHVYIPELAVSRTATAESAFSHGEGRAAELWSLCPWGGIMKLMATEHIPASCGVLPWIGYWEHEGCPYLTGYKMFFLHPELCHMRSHTNNVSSKALI